MNFPKIFVSNNDGPAQINTASQANNGPQLKTNEQSSLKNFFMINSGNNPTKNITEAEDAFGDALAAFEDILAAEDEAPTLDPDCTIPEPEPTQDPEPEPTMAFPPEY